MASILWCLCSIELSHVQWLLSIRSKHTLLCSIVSPQRSMKHFTRSIGQIPRSTIPANSSKTPISRALALLSKPWLPSRYRDQQSMPIAHHCTKKQDQWTQKRNHWTSKAIVEQWKVTIEHAGLSIEPMNISSEHGSASIAPVVPTIEPKAKTRVPAGFCYWTSKRHQVPGSHRHCTHRHLSSTLRQVQSRKCCPSSTLRQTQSRKRCPSSTLRQTQSRKRCLRGREKISRSLSLPF